MKRHIPLLVVAVAVGAGAFFGGMTYAKSTTAASPAAGARYGSRTGAGGQMAGNRANGGMTAGDVISKDNGSITVKAADGGSKLVFVNDATSIVTAASGTIDDVAVGKQVTVIGTAGSDGSITANMIQIGSVGFRGFGGGRATSAGAAPGGQAPAPQN